MSYTSSFFILVLLYYFHKNNPNFPTLNNCKGQNCLLYPSPYSPCAINFAKLEFLLYFRSAALRVKPQGVSWSSHIKKWEVQSTVYGLDLGIHLSSSWGYTYWATIQFPHMMTFFSMKIIYRLRLFGLPTSNSAQVPLSLYCKNQWRIQEGAGRAPPKPA